MKKILIIVAILVIVLAVTNKLVSSTLKLSLGIPKLFSSESTRPAPTIRKPTPLKRSLTDQKMSEEDNLVSIIDASLPSVVTVGINFTAQERGTIEFDPTNPFGFRQVPGRTRQVEQNIGSGFIVSEDGYIITNKHVVAEQNAKYKVKLESGDEEEVVNIYRDPLNDLAILKINSAPKLQALPMGDSDALKLGQTAIAIGTPLGEFTNSVTKGIISGLGRGITAGSPYEGFVERLDNVIQTDTPISPGNSGGPLLNSSGEVIGVNTAVSSEGESIGFAIPVNVIKTLLEDFERRGNNFERPYIGVQYRMLDRRTAIANGLVEGAYVVSVVEGSPAQRAGIQEEDVITKIDGQRVASNDEQSITRILLEKRVGQSVSVTFWREGQEKVVNITLEKYEN